MTTAHSNLCTDCGQRPAFTHPGVCDECCRRKVAEWRAAHPIEARR
jgi:hypothetical protein